MIRSKKTKQNESWKEFGERLQDGRARNKNMRKQNNKKKQTNRKYVKAFQVENKLNRMAH